MRVLQVIRVDQRRLGRVRRLQPDRAARAGPQVAGIQRDAPHRHRRHAMFDPGAKAKVELKVGGTGIGVGIPEAAGFKKRRGNRPLARQQVLQPGKRGPVRLGIAVIAVGAREFADAIKVKVVL